MCCRLKWLVRKIHLGMKIRRIKATSGKMTKIWKVKERKKEAKPGKKEWKDREEEGLRAPILPLRYV